MTRPLEDLDVRAAAALTHPLRIAILWALEDGPASPSELARRIEAPLEGVSYHVRKLHELGIIEADEPEVLEGNIRHPYRLTSRPWITEEAWNGLSTADRDALTFAIIQRGWHAARAALAGDGWRRPDSHISRVGLQLDEAGFAEVSAILVDAMRRIERAEARANERMTRESQERVDSTLVLLLFETPDTDATRHAVEDLHAYRRDRSRRKK